MVDKNFFYKTRILDGGMGQELLNRGLKPRGTLWSAEALIKEEYHQMIIDTHLDSKRPDLFSTNLTSGINPIKDIN